MRWYPEILGPRGLAQSGGKRGLLAALAMTGLAACSVHPIPEDVSPIPTEAIVAAARCELRHGLVDQVRVWFADEEPAVDPNVINPELVAEQLAKMKKLYPNVDLVRDWNEYMDIAIAYDWTFDITETNRVDAGLGFRLPFVTNPGNLDVGAGGSLTTLRAGKRTFKSQDKFSNLLTTSWFNFCNDFRRSSESTLNQPIPRASNLLYPITGSIGLSKAVKSFLKIAVQEGALDTFTDELTFITMLDGRAGASVTLSPVPKQFRLVSASANLAGTRVDLHKVKISLAFPKARPAQRTRKELVADKLKEMDALGGYSLNPNWRATYALCVVDARSREEELKSLRLTPPEVSCIESTDAFFPRGNGKTNALLTGRRRDLSEEDRERARTPPGTVNPRQQPSR